MTTSGRFAIWKLRPWNISNPGAGVASPIAFLGTPFFNGMAPKLRMLSLSKVHVPWSLVPCGQLTQLKTPRFDGVSHW
jgi:hypothetical protein